MRSYGVIDGGLELARCAFSRLEHKFSVRRTEDLTMMKPGDTAGVHTSRGVRYSLNLLSRQSVDLLLVEMGGQKRPTEHFDNGQERWESLVDKTPVSLRPKIIIEAWAGAAVLWRNGPGTQGYGSRWNKRGYSSQMRSVNACRVGGAVDQSRLMVVRVAHGVEWNWSDLHEQTTARPMSNLLTPAGLVPRGAGTRCRPLRLDDAVPMAMSDPMPSRLHSLICTEKGVRQLLDEEHLRSLGVPKIWAAEVPKLAPGLLRRTTSVFHWEYLSQCVGTSRVKEIPPLPAAVLQSTAALFAATAFDTSGDTLQPKFQWVPPDLRVGGEWYLARVQSLDSALLTYPLHRRDDLRAGALIALDHHRGNYTATHPDPTHLQLLWWEFPREHWDEIREGGSMNFMQPPVACIHPNGPMDAEQMPIAKEFVSELVDLGAMGTHPIVLTAAPMFMLPKDKQPGQWRVLANFKEGGQNAVVASDPVYLNRMTHILEQMYTGGYSAVVDASKFFYQFRTRDDDRPYLGCVDPISGEVLTWHGLPMGAGNSPALAGRFGLSFVRKIRERFALFSGTPRANTWWKSFEEDGSYDPKLGHGFVLVRADGAPAVKIWVHVDDFLIHGPTLEDTQEALKLFLDTAVDCGLLCHPGKLTPPQQEVHYCGFLLNSTSIPELKIPVLKKEKALAMVDYMIEKGSTFEHSRLSLSVVVGTLESLVEATPSRIGHTYLRRFHSSIHPGGLGTGAAPYYTRGSVSDGVLRDLLWWRRFLLTDTGRLARSVRAATLVPQWGDGSGTGTGGTLGLPSRPLEMWMGQWTPKVFSYSSNWKEAKTLHLSMLRIESHYKALARGTTLFYFTDNYVTYCIMASGSSTSPGLHRLVEEIKLIELRLGCTLVCVHVPGLVMIKHGADSLSRGVWVSPFHDTPTQQELQVSVFAPLHYDPSLVAHLTSCFSLPTRWSYFDWNQVWRANDLLDRHTVWFPPPEIARQALIFMLETWVERPWTTSALFVIPRTLAGSWIGLSKHLTQLCLLSDTDWHFNPPRLLPVPVIVLSLAPFVRRLTPPNPDRLDSAPLPKDAQWHRQQAAHVRGLPTRNLQPH